MPFGCNLLRLGAWTMIEQLRYELSPMLPLTSRGASKGFLALSVKAGHPRSRLGASNQDWDWSNEKAAVPQRRIDF
jgi:hypothetical protein